MKIDQQQIRTCSDLKALFLNKENIQDDEEQIIPADTNEQPKVRKEKVTKSLSEALEFFTSYENKNGKKSEKFEDVWNEFTTNVPDSTTTVEEKEKAISYIDRLIACDDITPELKNYWSNKKDIIEMEIQNIKNGENAKDSNYQDVVDEYNNFIQQHWCDAYPLERNNSLEFLESEEYNLTFYNTCISYIQRILACNDLPENAKANFEQEINHWNGEKQSRLGEINWHNQQNNIKTESFKDVIEEMKNAVPDSTTTLEEKKLAAGYIKRMLHCDDIPDDLKNYWSKKEDVLRMEMQNIINNQQIGNDENINDVANEWKEFTDMYWNKTPDFDSTADRVEYYRSYYNMYISFCDRALASSDISDEERIEWTRMKMYGMHDLNYHNRDLNRYNKENNLKTESFNDVFKEFNANIPDSTTTADEKNLAISYIERMLACDDIPRNMKIYWHHKKAIIQKELKLLK